MLIDGGNDIALIRDRLAPSTTRPRRKREQGEDHLAALLRELAEELHLDDAPPPELL